LTSLLLATVLHASLTATGSETYAEAHRQAEKGRPLVVLVSTDWCPPCQKMKKSILPQVRKRGLLRKVAFAIVNPDRDQKLAKRLTAGDDSLPQLILYRKTPEGWRRKCLVGRQSVSTVEKFINQAIQPDAASAKDVSGVKPSAKPVAEEVSAESRVNS